MHRFRTIRGRTALAIASLALGIVTACPGLVLTGQAQVPGPESFAKQPTTPLELWDAADYLVRTGQAKLAAPYLQQFLQTEPDDSVLLTIRDRYGVGAVLRLDDYPETRPFAKPIYDKFNTALKRRATDPERINAAIASLSLSRAEQDYGVARLKEAGPYAIPALIRAIESPQIDPTAKALIAANMGRLDRSVVPALVAALGAPNRVIAADAASALGAIGDSRAIPFLTYPAASPEESPLKDAARKAIERLTGKPFPLQAKTPTVLLADEAWKYHRHHVKFDSDPTIVWVWDGNAPAPRTVPVTVAESILGGRFAREALALDPANLSAQMVMVSLALEKAVERVGVGTVVGNDPTGAFATAMAAGPSVLTKVLKTAIADDKGPLAAVTALALGRVTDRDPASAQDTVSPLVAALSASSRRVQYAAASALVDLNPSRPFMGSSRLLPILSRFVTNRSLRALVLDGNANRGNSVAQTLEEIGYETTVANSGPEAFREAAGSADIELILIEPTTLQGAWTARDTIANLRADSRTAGLPILIFGPLDLQNKLGTMLSDEPRIGFVVTPTNADTARYGLNTQLAAMGTKPLSDEERNGFAQGAAALLATIASRPNSPLASGISQVEPALSQALNNPATAPAAATALGDIPGNAAQQDLTRVVLDASRPAALRYDAAKALERHIQKFGPLMTRDQEKTLVVALDAETDPAVASMLSAVYGALRPSRESTGQRLQAFQPRNTTITPTPTTPAPAPAPAAAPADDTPTGEAQP